MTICGRCLCSACFVFSRLFFLARLCERPRVPARVFLGRGLTTSHQNPLIRALCTTAPAHTSSLVSDHTRVSHAHARPLHPRSIGFCAIWGCISSSSSSSSWDYSAHGAAWSGRLVVEGPTRRGGRGLALPQHSVGIIPNQHIAQGSQKHVVSNGGAPERTTREHQTFLMMSFSGSSTLRVFSMCCIACALVGAK